MKKILMALALMPFMALAVTIGEAVDAPQMTFTTGGNANWFGQTSVSHDGVDAAQSGSIGNSQSTWMQTTFDGERDVSFWWKVSSESGYDYLRVYVDGVEQGAISGYVDWTQKSFHVSGVGSHTIKWTYSKDGSSASGSDCGWVDELVFTPRFAMTFYVNGATGSDENQGTSPETAKKTIQAAIDVSMDGDTILVAPGTYAPIAADNPSISIIAQEWHDETIIDGGGSLDCCTFGANLTNTVIRGFTIRNGGQGVIGGTAEWCTIKDCSGQGDSHGVLKNCLLHGNNGYNGSQVQGGLCFNCTLVGPYYTAYGCSLINCIVYGGDIINPGGNEWPGYPMREKVYTDDPHFVDAANGNYRLAADSPCIDAGNNAYVQGNADLGGVARVINCTVDIGCYEYDPLGEGLVARYKFDGNAKDSSGNENNGVVHGATLTTDRFGNADSAMRLGWGNWVQIADSDSLHSCTQRITLVVWAKVHERAIFYPDNTINYMTKGKYGYMGQKTRQFSLAEVYSEDRDYLAMNDPLNGLVDDYILTELPTPMATGVWRQVVMTYDGMVAKSYINGSLVAASNVTTSVGVSSGDLYIGKDLDGGVTEYCNADVDDIRIYNRALSAEEVKALYEEERGDDWVFTCTQYNFNTQPTSLAQAESFINDPSKISGSPVTKLYKTIAFGDNIGTTTPKFPTVSFPGNESSKAEYFAITSSGRLFVPSAGKWTFCCGSDDGFRTRLTRDDYSDEFSFGGERSFAMTFKTFDFPVSGIYDLSLSYYEQGINAICELSTAKGTYSSFDASAFKLVGTEESGILVVGPNTRVVTFDAQGGSVSNEYSLVDAGNRIEVLPTPTRNGYNFAGWYTAIEGGEQITEDTIVRQDMVAYARWIAIAYNIAYNDLRGVENPNPATYTIEDTIVFAPLADIGDIHFMEWDIPGIAQGSTSDMVVTAQWKDVSIGAITGATNVLWRTGGDVPWATEETAEGWDVRSGAIEKNSETWVECVVTNGCRVAFQWKVSCEPEDEGEMYDFLSFAIDGDQKAAICGEIGWTNDVYCVSGAGEHILRWTYQKDNRTSAGEDCGWLGKVKVDPEVPVTFKDNGATSGEVPTIPTAYLGDTITIPGSGTLAKSCHAFGGWEYGETTYQEGTEFTLGTNAVEFVAVWNAKVLGLPILVSPATPHVTTEKIAVSLQTPASAQGIRYTIDGTEPTAEGAVYVGPFEIEDRGVTVKAVAFADDWFDSACATWELTRAPWSAAECLNAETREFSFGGNADWVRDLSVTHDGEAAMRSGTITDKQTSQILMPVTGAGTVSFWCKVSSEWDPETKEVYDGLAIAIDGKDVYPDLIGGEVGWTNITVGVSGAGEHVICWRYQKDKVSSAGSDCAWIDEVLWQVNETVVPAAITGDRDLPISRSWIEKDLVDRYGPGKTQAFRDKFGNDYDLAVLMPNGKTMGGNPGYVWEDYIAGTDPTDTNSVFAASITMEGGVPKVIWEPDLGVERLYKVWGRASLVGGDWVCPTNSTHRFFKVTVEMP